MSARECAISASGGPAPVIDQSTSTVRPSGRLPRLPSLVSPWSSVLRRLRQRVEQRPRRARQRRERVGQLRWTRVEPPPALGRDRGTGSGSPSAASHVERLGAEERVAVAERRRARRCRANPSTRRGSVGEVVEEPQVLLERRPARRRRARATRPTSRISTAPPACVARRTDGGVVDARRREVDHARLPHPHRHAADVAGLAHDPVVAVVDVLEHERVAVDHDPFEARARLRVGALHRLPADAPSTSSSTDGASARSCVSSGVIAYSLPAAGPSSPRIPSPASPRAAPPCRLTPSSPGAERSCCRRHRVRRPPQDDHQRQHDDADDGPAPSHRLSLGATTRSWLHSSRIDTDLALALELADAADRITLARFRAGDLVVDTKPDLTPVTEADRAVEEMIRERLARAAPATRCSARSSAPPATPTRRLDRRSHRRHQGVRPRHPGVGHADRARSRRRPRGGCGVGAGARCAVVGRAWRGCVPRRRAGERVEGRARRGRAPGVRLPVDASRRSGSRRDPRARAPLLARARLRRLLAATCWWPTARSTSRWRSAGLAVWDLAAPLVVVEDAGGRFTDLARRHARRRRRRDRRPTACCTTTCSAALAPTS